MSKFKFLIFKTASLVDIFTIKQNVEAETFSPVIVLYLVNIKDSNLLLSLLYVCTITDIEHFLQLHFSIFANSWQ